MDWNEMETAPKDGTPILAARNNDCSWEYHEVWWSDDDWRYPWKSYYNSFPEGRLDYWVHLDFSPYEIL